MIRKLLAILILSCVPALAQTPANTLQIKAKAGNFVISKGFATPTSGGQAFIEIENFYSGGGITLIFDAIVGSPSTYQLNFTSYNGLGITASTVTTPVNCVNLSAIISGVFGPYANTFSVLPAASITTISCPYIPSKFLLININGLPVGGLTLPVFAVSYPNGLATPVTPAVMFGQKSTGLWQPVTIDATGAITVTPSGTALPVTTNLLTSADGTSFIFGNRFGPPGGAGPVETISFTTDGLTFQRPFFCKSSAILSALGAATTQIVALSGTTKIRICSAVFSNLSAATSTNVKFVEGTGANCAAGQTNLSASIFLGNTALATPNEVIKWGNDGPLITNTAGDALCVTSSAAGAVEVTITFAQY